MKALTLGLTLVKRIVDLHHGEIGVTSELGFGSKFIVVFPFVQPGAKQCEIEQQKVTAHSNSGLETWSDNDIRDRKSNDESRPLILLAEDNDGVATVFITMLEASGFQVFRAENGKMAVDFARENCPQLILMDIQMPVMDGLEAIRVIRKMHKFKLTPIIAVSGFAMPEDSDRCIEAGADLFVSKPCKMSELIVQVRELIGDVCDST